MNPASELFFILLTGVVAYAALRLFWVASVNAVHRWMPNAPRVLPALYVGRALVALAYAAFPAVATLLLVNSIWLALGVLAAAAVILFWRMTDV